MSPGQNLDYLPALSYHLEPWKCFCLIIQAIYVCLSRRRLLLLSPSYPSLSLSLSLTHTHSLSLSVWIFSPSLVLHYIAMPLID
jgi:hypothetical protein